MPGNSAEQGKLNGNYDKDLAGGERKQPGDMIWKVLQKSFLEFSSSSLVVSRELVSGPWAGALPGCFIGSALP